MKVSELITVLQQCDPESEIIVAGDPEGNHYFGLDEDGVGAISDPDIGGAEYTFSGGFFNNLTFIYPGAPMELMAD